LWKYVDTFSVVGPFAVSPYPGELIAADPVTGRSSEVNFAWQDLDYAQKYEFWLAKDDAFIYKMVEQTVGLTEETRSASLIYMSGIKLPGQYQLETGHTYYWKVRVREATTGEQVRSRWSTTMFFTVRPGLPANNLYMGPVLLNPALNTAGVPINPVAFSWGQLKEIIEYQFELSDQSDFSTTIVNTSVPTTSYSYNKDLDYSKSYFWRVKANRPFTSDWSPTFTFITQARPASKSSNTAGAQSPTEPPTPWWIWLLIVLAVAFYVEVVALVLARNRGVRRKKGLSDIKDIIRKSR
jgi:hypothetical protein